MSLRKNYGTFKSALLDLVTGRRCNEKKSAINSFQALKSISFDIAPGKTVGLIGRNGSGKSTLLKLIAGIYRADEGKVSINGRVSALIELGAGFHPEFSGRENVFINASILGMSRKLIQEKFDQIVAFAELEEFIDNPVRTYSSGMFMRLGFSVAVHVDPDILLVDEVLAVGDESFGNKCRDKMENFKKEGKTILLVTHDLSQVERWCDEVVWLDHGEVKMIGKPARVVDGYLETVAAAENISHLQAEAAKNGEPKHENDSNRWGTREVEVDRVTLHDESGDERSVFGVGAQLRIDIDYTAHQPVHDPVFGVGIFKQDGSSCYGTNTDLEGIEIEQLTGTGSISLAFTSLPLLDGSYTLSIAIHAKDGHAYDYHDQRYEFSFRSKIKDVGVFRPPHTWNLNGAPLRAVATDQSS